MATVRGATTDDCPRIRELIGGVFREYGLELLLDGVDAHLADPATYFRERGGEFWVVEDADGLVATVGVIPHEDDAAELKALYVHAPYRRQGWGRRLVEWVAGQARQMGKQRLILWSDTRFLDAHRLYRTLGFRLSGERELHDAYQSREYGFEVSLVSFPADRSH